MILLYHRIAELRTDPWTLAVTPRHFLEHLEALREHTRPIRLQHLPQALFEGGPRDRSVVVTFDDGYADNLYNAKPVLERYDIPATTFLTTAYMGQEREIWSDDLDRLLLQPGMLPEEMLCLSIGGSTYRWELGEAVHYGEDDFKRHRCWKAWETAPSPRHSLYSSLWEMLHPLTEGERRRVLDELVAWAGAESTGRSTHRCLTVEEVYALAQGSLVEVGAHTVTHPTLSTLSTASQQKEIHGSKTYLEEVLGRPVNSFAYPYGKQNHYTAQTVSIVRETGFSCACSGFPGVVERSTDRFQLPRVHVRDWDGEAFARQLSKWFGPE